MMSSLYVWLSTVLLSVSVQGSNFSSNGWSMTVADGVWAEEGGSAVLPCSFTHPDTNLTLTGSVIWYNRKSMAYNVIFNCTYPGPDHSQGELCENVRQRDGGNRFRFAGNLSNNDVSLMMEELSLEDTDPYQCRVVLNIDSFQTMSMTQLEVEAAQGNVSVVSGTEGDSVTLPCIFSRWDSHTLTTVTWMRKEPYQHIVTFTAQSQGTWTTGHGGNRYELIGNPEEGNASTRINQLRVRDNHTYLCLVEYRSKPDYQYLIQKETRLMVHVRRTVSTAMLVISLVSLLLILIMIIFVIFRKKEVCSLLIEYTRSSKRKEQGLSSTPGSDQTPQPKTPDQDSSSPYAEIDSNRTGDKRFTISPSEDPQPDSLTYASIVINSSKKEISPLVPGSRNVTITDAEGDVTYATVIT
ncbi:uncharacterized protein LOC132826608 isoform X2 [Hemiscyllium ocellatum]|uniref:uncharacterized protein LOC132826608 isoform X2 n=1 Tax=Hemiscyllium ocellatum TaxID=170820 RepID=UPI00296722B2|nr:uncharacterized protein LOC132826608 isoform X2 [Hemiscyllium ocellatum]